MPDRKRTRTERGRRAREREGGQVEWPGEKDKIIDGGYRKEGWGEPKKIQKKKKKKGRVECTVSRTEPKPRRGVALLEKERKEGEIRRGDYGDGTGTKEGKGKGGKMAMRKRTSSWSFMA